MKKKLALLLLLFAAFSVAFLFLFASKCRVS
jgi:hypothetical protein